MASRLSPRVWSANLLGSGTRTRLPTSPHLLLISFLLRFLNRFLRGMTDNHYLKDQSCPSSSSSPSLPYLRSVHSSSTAHGQHGQRVSNAHPKTSSATYLVGCGTAHSGRRTVTRGTVQLSLDHRCSFRKLSKARTRGRRCLLLCTGRGMNQWELVGVFHVHPQRWNLLLRYLLLRI